MSRLYACIAIIVALAACSGDTSGQTPTSTPRPQQTPVILASATPTVVPALSVIDLERTLITREDLDLAWYGSSDTLPVLEPSASCAPERPFDAFGPVAATNRTLSQSDRGPWLTELLYLYPDRNTASEAFDTLREGFNCREWRQLIVGEPQPFPTMTIRSTTSPTAGSPASGTATPDEIPWTAAAPSDLDYRAQSFVAGLESQTDPQIEIKFVAVRENNLILIVAHWSPFDIDTDVTMTFVDLALERLDAALE